MSFYRLRVKRGNSDMLPMVTSDTPFQTFSVGETIDFTHDEFEGPRRIVRIEHLVDIKDVVDEGEESDAQRKSKHFVATGQLTTLYVE